jgi:hypothetical protein
MSADRIERQARARLASVALDLKPSEPAVEALSNDRRRLRWAAIGFHPDRPQFGLCAVSIALSLLRQLTRLLGADFRAHDPATEDNLALLRAHGWRLQPPLRRRANATRIRRQKSPGYTNNPCSGAFGLRSVTSSPARSDQQASADDSERAERPPRPPDSADVHVPRVDKHA